MDIRSPLQGPAQLTQSLALLSSHYMGPFIESNKLPTKTELRFKVYMVGPEKIGGCLLQIQSQLSPCNNSYVVLSTSLNATTSFITTL